MFDCLHHVAYRCRDAQTTVDFYTKVVGLPYVAGLKSQENHVPSWPYQPEGEPAQKVVAAPADSIHIFFELGDGSYLAFFDVASSEQESDEKKTPWWVNHIAFETSSMEQLHAAKVRLEEHGVQVLGPKNHGFCQSIYFLDPDGHRLEITFRSEQPDTWHKLASAAPEQLKIWNEFKKKKYNQIPGKVAPLRTPADMKLMEIQ